MFEKEAEEYAEGMAKYYESAHGSIPSQFEKYLRKAVEYGYRKANEWHYVKEGDLPKENTQVLVLLENKRMKISIFMENKFTVWNKDYDTYTKLYNVIAWKEIVLPELPKESE